MFGWGKTKNNNSRTTANERLRVVLMHDRIGSSPQLMNELRDEIMAVIVRHVEIEGRPEITISTQGRQSVLDINIPLKSR